MSSCSYRNASGQMVILRCIGRDAFFLEKVIFPFEDLHFSCPAQSRVELWTHGIAGAELLDTLEAEDLLVSANAIKSVSRAALLPELNLV